ncbi:oligoendopeptidase F [Thermoflavimicrobium dichotomicum]|uniref:Oligopeptidase F n=1 Tax=Thermoflavimicrobium dichotomicum TaxID=46223 RepID=A0A1I3R673_9BACL|nr:oligoendopeptidase F [Thermoflavimicrobium dichotomicum]SFJ42104.1 oligoendopeptidase F [Thermoflavimicrobium dichotomicum]
MASKKAVKKLPTRSEIPAEYTWRLEDIFATDEEWEKEFEAVKNGVPELQSYQGKLGQSADQLLAALKCSDEIFQRIEKLYTYAHMRFDQDTTNAFYQSMRSRIISLYTEARSAKAYLVPEILAIDEQKLKSFLEENPELKVYEYALQVINEKREHVLSPDEEALLAGASEIMDASRHTAGLLSNADLKFPTIIDEDGNEVELTQGRYIQFLRSHDRRVRKDAFLAMYGTYGQFVNTFASTLSATVKKHNYMAKIRKYNSARHASLSEKQIPEVVYDQLVETINEHLHLLHRYMEMRKRAMGLTELHMYDVYATLVEDVKMKITYDEAKDILLQGLSPMGEDYLSIVREGLQNRWVDVYENKGKRSGAYSSGAYGTNPYILMNWQDNLDNLFTLAHEFGHSVHSYYTRKTQPYVYGDYSIFVAEVASTCNELLLNDYLLKTTNDRKKRIYLITHQLEDFRATVFRQTMFAEFEHLIHQKAQQGEALTAEQLTSWYYALNQKYFGKHVVSDQEIGIEWTRIPHFYYNYYVYQYATGFSAAAALSKQILTEGKPAVDRYIDFLKAGSSASPIDVLKKAGVDMTSPEPIRAALQVFEENLDELEKLLFEKE